MDPERIFMRNANRKFHCQLMMLGLSFLYLLAGVMDVAIGVAARYQLQGLTSLIEIDTCFLIMILIVGVLLILLSFMGCKGANDEKVAHLIVHSIVTFNSILISVVMTVLCTVTCNGVMDAPNHFDEFITTFQNYGQNGLYVDDVQIKYQCCGPNHGYTYWNDTIPASCYKDHDTVLVVSDILYTEGCIEEILITVKDLLLYTLVMNYVSVITLVLGFICSVVLCILKYELFATRPPPSPPPESIQNPSTISVDQPPNPSECMGDRPPSYQEAVSAFQVMEPDFLQVPEEIEMSYLPTNPPAYENISFSL